MARRTKKELEDLKSWAKSEFLNNGIDVKAISKKIGVTEKTIGKWRSEEKWDKLRAATVISKPEQLAMIYDQINELNTHIRQKPEGSRYANSKEADALKKLTAAAKDLEGELGLSEIINVSIPILRFIKKINYEHSQIMQGYFDAFIRDKMNG